MAKTKHQRDGEAAPRAVDGADTAAPGAGETAGGTDGDPGATPDGTSGMSAAEKDDDVAPRRVTRKGVVAVEGARYADRDERPDDHDASAEEDEAEAAPRRKKLKTEVYEAELAKLAVELHKLEDWVTYRKLRIVVLFEGRDAAGKGGAIKTITAALNPRVARVVALGVPTEREKTQWYFQRYVAHLPAAGEIVFFDRSWYNRAGVEHVMGFCTELEYQEFLRSCPEFERMLIRSGILVFKYWFSVSEEEQERRFLARLGDPTKRWKLSPIDLASRTRWVDYSRAKDEMFAYTDIKQSQWNVVNADDKKRARLNMIRHLLSQIPYEEVPSPEIVLPARQTEKREGYMRPPITDMNWIPEVY
jgi:polyphosphate kinase 2